ncbi:branched-chain amino acid ABC transporter permease [Haloarchaeobius litoreus]|uniref:Branched-chain amino acid ABC transporter permease n=1 Tax=Haloarchaeobius litoreus TaxID=755306 RepID=A0ABD6DI73_9EURY|nr:branched-chain amino acid ABC transporter permease [Haloarchaeobius litoreus]
MSADATATRGLVGLLDPRRYGLRHQVGAVGLVLLALAPYLVPTVWVRNLTIALFFAMFAMSWDVVSGYTGQISFGHAFFFAIGGYSSALLNLELGLPPVVTVPVAVVVTVVAGLLVGVPALRLRGPYFSLVTLVAPTILLNVFILFSDTFGGELGLDSPAPILSFDDLAVTLVANYYLAFALFVGILAVLLAVTRSDAGAVFTAIREDEDAVAASGLNPAKFKVFAFALSAAVGGLAGAVFVHTPIGNPNPSQLLALTVSIEVIIAAILGGMGTIVGAAVAGIFLRLFQLYLGTVEYVVPVLDTAVADVDLLLFSLVTLVLLFALPGGIVRWAVHGGGAALDNIRGRDAATDGGRDPPDRDALAAVRESWREDVAAMQAHVPRTEPGGDGPAGGDHR